MRIVAWECHKALTSPVLMALVLLFLSFNVFLMADRVHMREELKVANELAETYGVQMTDASLKRFREDLAEALAALNEITRGKTGQTYASFEAFFKAYRFGDDALYSEEERAFFARLQLKATYDGLAAGIDARYGGIDWPQIGENVIAMYGLTGTAAEMVRNEYKKLAERVEDIQRTDEHKTWFFAGNLYRMHSFLFRTLFLSIIFESLIVSVLATALITNFEFENRLHRVAYATKRGRRLLRDKLAASYIIATAVTAFLLFGTLTVYFAVFDYSHLWTSSIGSALNWEYLLPYVPWWKVSFLDYLLLSIGLTFISMLLFTTVVFALSVFVKNNYFTFFLFAAFFAVALLLPRLLPSAFGLKFLAGFTLPQLVMNPHQFFMGSALGPRMVEHYELLTISLWTVMAFGLAWTAWKKFQTSDLH